MAKQNQPAQVKVPPQAVESEQALLCACFLRPDIIPQVKDMVSAMDFYRDAHAIIFTALCDVGKQSDPITIGEYLKQTGLFDRSGGMPYITELAETLSTSAGWKYHAEILKDRANRRNMIQLCQKTIDQSFDLASEYEETLSSHKGMIREYESDNQQVENETNLVLCKKILRDIERRIETKNPYAGIKVGFVNIDEKMWGLEPGTTLYVIARPSMGKTALCLNIARYVSTKEPGLVLYFSLESSAVYLMRRIVSSYSSINLTKLRKADIRDEQWPQLTEAFNDISENKNLRILSHPRYKQVERLVSRVETYALESPISLIVVDHIQRMNSSTKRQSRHLEISYISEQLTSLAQSLNVPMIVLSQLRRGLPGSKEGRPQLSELKESGDLEANADGVWSIYRKDREAELTEIECLKGRDTGTWKTSLRFDRFTQKFYDMTDETFDEEPVKDTWMDRER